MDISYITGLATGEFSPVRFYGLFFGSFLISLLIIFSLWLYLSFAYKAISNKLIQTNSGVSFIPFFGPIIIAFRASKMHWWPWLFLIGFFFKGHLIPLISTTLFFAFVVVWHWKMFKKLGKPQWWSVFLIIPFATLYLFNFRTFHLEDILPTLGIVVHCVLVGITAWKGNKKQKVVKGIILGKVRKSKNSK